MSEPPDAVEVDDVVGADAVEFAVEERVSEAAMDCEDDEDCAVAKPTRAVMMTDFEKYMATVCIRVSRQVELLLCECVREWCRRLAL